MNTELEQNQICLTSSPVTFSVGGLKDTQIQTVSLHTVPSLEEMLDQIGPLPRTALVLGQAEDELPVLLDLSNPRPGPILITADRGAGKTRLLQVIAQFTVSTHMPQEIQYGVITSRPEEWSSLAEAAHCVGIFPATAKRATEFVHALWLWTCMEKTHRQYVLLLIDGLDELTSLNGSAAHEMHTILAEGPSHRIWPIATLDPSCSESAGDWLKHFHTRVLGYTSSGEVSEGDETLSKGIEFSLKKGSQRIKFWVPRI